jgi:hypothetical protein
LASDQCGSGAGFEVPSTGTFLKGAMQMAKKKAAKKPAKKKVAKKVVKKTAKKSKKCCK